MISAHPGKTGQRFVRSKCNAFLSRLGACGGRPGK
jgi:hypothetical protein